ITTKALEASISGVIHIGRPAKKIATTGMPLLLGLRQSGIPVVAIFLAGRPMWITPEMDASNAFVVAWLPGTEAAGIADLLFRNASGEVDYDFTGKLSFSWPRDVQQTSINRGDTHYHPLFPYGFGLTYR